MKKKKWLWISIIFIAVVGGAVCWYFNRKAPLYDVPEGVCPRCVGHDVRRWGYGLGTMDTEEVIGGGCVVSADSPQYHCDICGFDWGVVGERACER